MLLTHSFIDMFDFYEIKEIPFAKEYLVSTNGLVFHKETKIEPGRWVDGNEGIVTLSLNVNGSWMKARLNIILASAFIPVPKHLEFIPKLIVGFLDGDKGNYSIKNLYWTTTKEVQDKKWYLIRKAELEKYPLPDFSLAGAGLFPGAIACKQKEDYYHIPICDGHVVINKSGDLFDLVNQSRHDVRFCKKGYVHTTLRVGKKFISFPVHRIVGLLFCEKPDRHQGLEFDELQVNHKDGVKTNNHYENLEWVTNLENMIHARSIGLFKNETKVIGRDLSSGEIFKYRSISECARLNFLSASNLRKHLYSTSAGRVSRDNQVFKLDDDSNWPSLLYTRNGEVEEFSYICDVAVEHVTKEQTYLFASLPEACDYLKLNINIVKNTRARKGPETVCLSEWIFRSVQDY